MALPADPVDLGNDASACAGVRRAAGAVRPPPALHAARAILLRARATRAATHATRAVRAHALRACARRPSLQELAAASQQPRLSPPPIGSVSEICPPYQAAYGQPEPMLAIVGSGLGDCLGRSGRSPRKQALRVEVRPARLWHNRDGRCRTPDIACRTCATHPASQSSCGIAVVGYVVLCAQRRVHKPQPTGSSEHIASPQPARWPRRILSATHGVYLAHGVTASSPWRHRSPWCHCSLRRNPCDRRAVHPYTWATARRRAGQLPRADLLHRRRKLVRAAISRGRNVDGRESASPCGRHWRGALVRRRLHGSLRASLARRPRSAF